MTSLDDVWGARLVCVELNPVTHRCEFHALTTVGGVTSAHVISCEGVAEFRFRNSIPEPWAYAEVTEAHLGREHSSGRQRLELMLWSEASSITVLCSSVAVRDITGAAFACESAHREIGS